MDDNQDRRIKHSDIDPLEGWEPNCKYGFQMIDDSPWGRLVNRPGF